MITSFPDVSILMEGENEVAYCMMRDNYKVLKKDLSSRGITKELVFYFDEPDEPSIFKIHRRKEKGLLYKNIKQIKTKYSLYTLW